MLDHVSLYASVCAHACLIFFVCMSLVCVCVCVEECSLLSKHRHSTADSRHSLSVRDNRPVLETIVLLSALLSLK